jgi:hypothetical protein
MKATIELPKASSIRDERDLPLILDLTARLNPKILVVQVATSGALFILTNEEDTCLPQVISLANRRKK